MGKGRMMQTQILYEDEAVLVIRKPAGLATESAGIAQKDVVSELKNHISRKTPGKQPYLGVVHRLDQPVEGLLVFGKTQKAADHLTGQLNNGSLKKEYLAVVCGKVSDSKGSLVDNLKKEKGMAVIDETGRDPAGRKAVLFYEQVGRSEDSTLLKIHIETGRFHQIRAQLSHAGFPILGDEKYGTQESRQLSGKKGIRFVALCACHIRFQHPVTGKQMDFTEMPQNPAFDSFPQGILGECGQRNVFA